MTKKKITIADYDKKYQCVVDAIKRAEEATTGDQEIRLPVIYKNGLNAFDFNEIEEILKDMEENGYFRVIKTPSFYDFLDNAIKNKETGSSLPTDRYYLLEPSPTFNQLYFGNHKHGNIGYWIDREKGKFKFNGFDVAFKVSRGKRQIIFIELIDLINQFSVATVPNIELKTGIPKAEIRIVINAINKQMTLKNISLFFKGTGQGYVIRENFSIKD